MRVETLMGLERFEHCHDQEVGSREATPYLLIVDSEVRGTTLQKLSSIARYEVRLSKVNRCERGTRYDSTKVNRRRRERGTRYDSTQVNRRKRDTRVDTCNVNGEHKPYRRP